jgi:hypothetical protein
MRSYVSSSFPELLRVSHGVLSERWGYQLHQLTRDIVGLSKHGGVDKQNN